MRIVKPTRGALVQTGEEAGSASLTLGAEEEFMYYAPHERLAFPPGRGNNGRSLARASAHTSL